MSIIIGSARIDERGRASGGAAGDQKQTSTPDYRGEVSMQEFYVSSKGWMVIRAKSDSHAKKIAKRMEAACNNKNIGYNQADRYGVVRNGIDTKKKTNADCSSLVRECVKEATGKDPGDFNTEIEVKILEKTGLFEKAFEYKRGTVLYTGDILVTKTKGHTVIVVKGASRGGGKEVAEPTLRRGDKGTEVSILQKNLNAVKQSGKDGKKLTVDGDFGPNTEYAVRLFQKAKGLSADGIYGPKTYAALKKAL